MEKFNFCFERTTSVLYRESLEGNVICESVEAAYQKHGLTEDTVYVCSIDPTNGAGEETVKWVPARMCHTLANKFITIVVEPVKFIDYKNIDTKHIIRVTPNHMLPVINENGAVKDKEAYLLQTGDVILYEAGRIYGENETPLFISEDSSSDEIALEDLYADYSKHKIESKRVAKVVENDVLHNEVWDYYGFVIDSESNPERKHYIITNGIINHDSTVNY